MRAKRRIVFAKRRSIMKTISIFITISLCLTSLYAASNGIPVNKNTKEIFYTRPALFSHRPKSNTELIQSIKRFGPVGIGIELHAPAFVMKVQRVEEGSPAAATGKIKQGQFIESINGEKLKDIDPRIQLGNIITKAEATDGKVTLSLRNNKNSIIQEVTVNIPALGSYSKTWPLNCKKSDQIVRNLAEKFKKDGWNNSIGLEGPRMMFLLSTGDDSDLDVVRGWVKQTIENYKKEPTYAWHIAWTGPAFAEYYLRTGDNSVLPLLHNIANGARKVMYNDGWGGRGMAGHHMGLAGTGTLSFLLLARLCGVEVEEGMLQTALVHYYRFAGKGTNPYFDAHPEVTFTDNGRNGRLALAMQAAVCLDPAGENGVYAKARDVAAMHSFYSNSYMLHGHTGGGIGEVWRSQVMALMKDKKPHHYREFMDTRTWWYELSRRFDGSFGVVGGANYDTDKGKNFVGISVGLTYTVPRKHLVLYGAKSESAKPHKIPSQAWGSLADNDFLNIEGAEDENGKIVNIDHETLARDTGLPVVTKLKKEKMSDENILKYIYHPQHMFRAAAADKIGREKLYHLIPNLLRHKDSRVRHAGLRAMLPNYAKEDLPKELKAELYRILNNKNESWYVWDKLLSVLSNRPAAELVDHRERILSFVSHKEQWLRHNAVDVATVLLNHKESSVKVLTVLEREVPGFTRFPKGISKIVKRIENADQSIKQAVVKSLGKIYQKYPDGNTNPPGGLHPATEIKYLSKLAGVIKALPNGADMLFKVSKERYPNDTLPYKEQYLNAKNLTLSPELQEALKTIVIEELIPIEIANSWSKIKHLAALNGERTDKQDAIDSLAQLYTKGGIEGYNWQSYGTDRHNNTWEYFSFVPKEEGPQWANEKAARYREVTYPKGMDNWFSEDFNANKLGWKKGQAPFSNFDNKLGKPSLCKNQLCGCGDQPKTLWKNEVLLMRRTFKLPPIEEGYRYRLLVGGRSHVGIGDGYCIYINGRKIVEATSATGRNSGGKPKGTLITTDFMNELKKSKVIVAATAFLRQSHKTHKMHGNINIWFQKQKIPPFSQKQLLKSAELVPMKTSEWQSLQNPDKEHTDSHEGKFHYDGTFKENKALLGKWTVIAKATNMETFSPDDIKPIKKPRVSKTKSKNKNKKSNTKGKKKKNKSNVKVPKAGPMTNITLMEEGKTDAHNKLWTDNILLVMGEDGRHEALK